MIKCPSCSGEMSFYPALQKVKCNYCYRIYSIDELSKLINVPKSAILEQVDEKEMRQSKEPKTFKAQTYKCSQCGATLMTFDDTAITFCSYCGSQAMLADKMITHNEPDFVIPFKKTKEECIEAYKQKVSRFLFAPKYMKKDTVVEKFRGIYMPYAIYNMYQEGPVKRKW